MKKLAIAGLTMLFVGATAMSALAEKIPNETPGDPSDNPGNCVLEGYKQILVTENPLTIPDGDPNGVNSSVANLPDDGSTITDVSVSLNMSHTWIGDLNLQLLYDHDCTAGTPPFGPVSLMCRQQLAGCPVDGCCGCSGDLLNGASYQFSTNAAATKEIAADAAQCTASIAPGCYRSAVESQFTFSIFSGLRKGGCWYLHAQDGAGADTGSIQTWRLYLKNQQTTAVESATWGSVKAGFTL